MGRQATQTGGWKGRGFCPKIALKHYFLHSWAVMLPSGFSMVLGEACLMRMGSRVSGFRLIKEAESAGAAGDGHRKRGCAQL